MSGKPLKNPRHEKFANIVASGTPAGPAYAMAGFKVTTMGARDTNAGRLLRNAEVAGRVEELKLALTQEVIQASGLSKSDVLQMLWEQHLRNTGKLMVTHRIKATKGKDKGKIVEVTTTEYDARAAGQTLKLLSDEFGMGQGGSASRGVEVNDIDSRAAADSPHIIEEIEGLKAARRLVLAGGKDVERETSKVAIGAALKKLAGEK